MPAQNGAGGRQFYFPHLPQEAKKPIQASNSRFQIASRPRAAKCAITLCVLIAGGKAGRVLSLLSTTLLSRGASVQREAVKAGSFLMAFIRH